MPKVSVIMGVYNVRNKNYLEKSINSILNQTYKNFEFIICDDGSTNETYKLINELIKNDDRCLLIQNKRNMGLAQTLNNCISIAKGEYIARMDDDDISIKERLEKQVIFLDENPDVDVLGTNAYFIDSTGKRYNEFVGKETIKLEDTIKKCKLIHPSVMMRKKALNLVGDYTVSKLTTRAEDYDLWCKMAERGSKIKNLNTFLLEYREDRDSLKKRKYIHRIEEFKLKKYWIKRAGYKQSLLIYAYKPLIVGLIPNFIMARRKAIIKKLRR